MRSKGRESQLTGSSPQAGSPWKLRTPHQFAFHFFASASTLGYEYASTSVFSGGCEPSVSARASISTAVSIVKEVTTAAHKAPWSTSGLLLSVTPTPAHGSASHFALSGPEVVVSNAFLAPVMKSAFCETIN